MALLAISFSTAQTVQPNEQRPSRVQVHPLLPFCAKLNSTSIEGLISITTQTKTKTKTRTATRGVAADAANGRGCEWCGCPDSRAAEQPGYRTIICIEFHIEKIITPFAPWDVFNLSVVELFITLVWKSRAPEKTPATMPTRPGPGAALRHRSRVWVWARVSVYAGSCIHSRCVSHSSNNSEGRLL